VFHRRSCPGASLVRIPGCGEQRERAHRDRRERDSIVVIIVIEMNGRRLMDERRVRSEAAADAVAWMIGEIWSRGNLDLIPQVYAPDHVRHEPGGDDGIGFETARSAAARVHARFPGTPQTEHILLADGDAVFRRWSFVGVHHAPDGPVSETPVMLDAMTVCRLRDGLLAETWTTADWQGLERQLAGEPYAGDDRCWPQALAASGDDPEPRRTALRAVREVLGEGRVDRIPALFDERCRDHRNWGAAGNGPDAIRERIAGLHAAVSGLELDIDPATVVAAGPWVAVPWTATATQTGEIFGLAPTGRRATWGGQTLTRVEDGQIVEVWQIEDIAGMLRRFAGG
jgi:predicted ester cyclase